MIFIKTLQGRTLTLDVEPHETVFDIKQRIEQLEGIAAEDQRLLSCGKFAAFFAR